MSWTVLNRTREALTINRVTLQPNVPRDVDMLDNQFILAQQRGQVDIQPDPTAGTEQWTVTNITNLRLSINNEVYTPNVARQVFDLTDEHILAWQRRQVDIQPPPPPGGPSFTLPLIAKGDLLTHDGTNIVRLPVGPDGFVLTADSSDPTGLSWTAVAGVGTVTSVDVSGGTTGLTFSGGPIIAAGVITMSGTLAIANGGTGATTALAAFNALSPLTTAGDILTNNGVNDIRLGIGTANQIIGANAAATAIEYKSIVAGTNITVVHGAGSITINATGGIADPGTNGIMIRTALNVTTARSLIAPAAGITITNPDGVSGNPTFALANDLAALEGLGSTGLAVRTGADTWANRSLVAPLAGITITNPGGVAGDPTFALANDLAAVEGLATTGYAVRTVADTWATRSIVAASSKISITNGDGTAGNTSIDAVEANFTLDNIGGTLSISKGGTGATTALTAFNNLSPLTSAGDVLTHNGTNNIRLGIGTANQILGANAGATALEYKTVTAGTGITVTHGVGSITIAATGTGLSLYDENPSAPTAPNASGTNAVAIGNGVTASGTDSIVLGGNDNLASATYSSARGSRAVASMYGAHAFASDAFSADGDGQVMFLTAYANTTDATVTVMFLDGPGGSQRLVLPNDTSWGFRILVTGRETGETDTAVYQFLGGIKRGATAASTTLVGASQTTVVEDDVDWDVDIVADTTNGALQIEVEGEAGDDINWVAFIELVQVTY